MTMVYNAYKTQQGTTNKIVPELLIAGFSGQLKGCCGNRDNNGVRVNLTSRPFRFWNGVFWSSGCGSLATVFSNKADMNPIVSCLQPSCRNIHQTSNAACLMIIPWDVDSFVANITEIGSSNGRGSAFWIDSSYINIQNMTMNSDLHDLSNRTHVPATL
ncbi:hypothetical protein PTKIN_Ptkin17bG0043000 [Pterospermum kingtungense]